MPFALITAGLIMIVSAIQNTHQELWAQIRKDFTGPGNFTYWLASIGMIGAVGYIKPLRPVALAFLFLILVVLFVSQKGLAPKLTEALKTGPIAPPSSR